MIRVPGATYRIQFSPGFTFRNAAGIADYLSELGISHVYASPYLQAARGSTHGYDVVDPGRVNEDLGGEEGHRELCSALHERGMGQVLDVVPNHMAITEPENIWWRNVLENGPSSPYAAYFDVDWDPPEERMGNRILLPVLGDHYGRVIESGEIRLVREKNRFYINYHDHSFPAAPSSLVLLLKRAVEIMDSDRLGFIIDCLCHLPLPEAHEFEHIRRRYRNWMFIQNMFARALEENPETCKVVDRVVEEVNASPDLLDAFLDEQNYRLAFWRAAERDLGYRRFFNINTLIGMRMEDRRVFNDTHRLVLEWLKDGVLDGLRVDHPDGLRDPEQYFKRLREASPDTWVVAEKILHPGEKLPSEWSVAGTTGYDFLNILNGLFIDPAGEKPLTDFYAWFTGEETDYSVIAREKKHKVLHELLASDVNRLTELMVSICAQHRLYRDYTRWEINESIREFIACFPVYRTYVRENEEVREEDRRVISEAIHNARNLRPELDPDLFGFFESLFFLKNRGEQETEWVMRFQQLTGPAAAKGIEDTAFYCFNRLVCLNEVGGDPSLFGVSIESFHNAMIEAAECRPCAMLATSTHDTKRSEDMRARLAVLSEITGPWNEAVRNWSIHNEKYRLNNIPDRNAEYLLYQTLAGAWPIETERVVAYMEKAAREAGACTSWTQPDAGYEKGLIEFAESVLDDRDFLRSLEKFVSLLVEPGRINSMSQVLIKLLAPGVPDFYQGTELWDLSLVDPDNRRPVDFDLRRRLLSRLRELSPEEVMAGMDNGLPKLWVIHKALELRRKLPEVFLSGDYRPVKVSGQKADHAVSFLRSDKAGAVVPRLLLSLKEEWRDTWLEIPEGQWFNHLTGESFRGGKVAIGEILARFPAALISKERIS